jgi:hypothetical protein
MRTLKKMTGLFLLISAISAAGAPSQDFSLTSLGLEYNGIIRGQYITEKDVASYQRIQILYLHYAPVQYTLFSAGFGATRMSVAPYSGVQFHGNYGFSPSFGLSLFTPFFLYDIMRVSGGAFVLFLNSEDQSHFVYRGPVLNPYAGLVFSAGHKLDIGVGCRGHLIFGKMVNTKTNGSSDFSNRNMLRAYGSLTLHAPSEGAFLTVDADLSPKTSSAWNDGPLEASLGFSVGVVLRTSAPNKEKSIESAYFPAYKEMKEMRKKMSKEIE